MSERDLKKALFAAYGGFADLRVKDLNKASKFIVDYRRTDATDRKVYGNSCLIFADVVGAREVRITLSNAVPCGITVSQWARAQSITRCDGDLLEFSVTPASVDDLESLAGAFRAIVEGGKRYDAAHYKYTCPRTATSLEKLARVLRQAWS